MHWQKRVSRRRNYNEPGHAHELTCSCFQRYQFLIAERARTWLTDAIADARQKLDFALWCYVVMPEHMHLIVHPRQPVYEIDDILAAIKQPVARRGMAYLRKSAPEWLPKLKVVRSRRSEFHFWQIGGGFDRNVIKPKTLQAMIDYIHANPVRRGLVTRPEDWVWSSAAWFLRGEQGPIPVDAIPPDWC